MAEIVNGNSLNETHAHERRSRSTFPLKQMILDTHRFGEYHPHFFLDGVTGDSLPIRSSHKTMSYTLKAPLMQDVMCHKDYFQVPLRSILPFNCDKIVTNPPLGDDVPNFVYTAVDEYPKMVHKLLSGLQSYMFSDRTDNLRNSTLFLKFFVLAESILSYGSLSASLGANFSPRFLFFYKGSAKEIDAIFDAICTDFLSTVITGNVYCTAVIDGHSYRVYSSSAAFTSSPSYRDDVLTFREFLEKIRDTSDWHFDFLPNEFDFLVAGDYDPAAAIPRMPIYDFVSSNNDMSFDLAPLWAYQLVCSEFYSNSHVDYIYSAQVFRDYISSLLTDLNFHETFSYNGVSTQYDWLSAVYFHRIVNDLYTEPGLWDNPASLQYFLVLFGYKRSLRYKDYFTGSRTRPLAVGDTNIPVTGNNVSVVDVSRSIQLQRFLNTVNATGRKFEEYLKAIFGVAPAPDMHNPLFLAHSSDSLFAQEVENTGDIQWEKENSVTAIFRGNSSNYEYRVDLKEPSFIIGITSYDIERAYTGGVDRLFFKKDRFDMFLPDLQFVGDQPVYNAELFAGNNKPLDPFGYQFRDMQFKQLVNRACGGFATDRLPGYAFLAPRFSRQPQNISPNFIRSAPHELDQFYTHLTGFSLGTYFHFIVLLNNTSDASRPMAVNPQILQ